MTKDEALDLALEALEYWAARDEFSTTTRDAITALRTAIEQAEKQEPEYCDPSTTIYKLAEMVMSDCGHSTNNQRLLDRVADRIQRHIDATTPPAQPAPVQEPVTWGVHDQQKLSDMLTAQRQWVGLTDEERGQAINANFGNGLWHMAKDIEAKLKEKNA